MFHVVRSGQRVHGLRHPALIRDNLLRPQRERRRVGGGQRQRLVIAIRMQGLRASKRRRQRLHGHAHDVVEWLLGGEGHAPRLRVEAQPGAGVAGTEAFAHQARVEPARGPKLRDLLEEVAVAGEEKAQPRREGLDVEAAGDRAAHVLQGVAQREGELLHRRRASLANVVARDRDRIPQRRLGGAEPEGFRDQRERGLRRKDVRATGDILLEDVVLDRAAEPGPRNAALLRADDVHREQDRPGRVDRHARAHLVKGDALEQEVHVLDAVDRHADAAHFAFGERGIAIESHLRREVEGDTESGLSGVEQEAESLVGLARRAEARVLAHRPEPAAIHRGLHAARERKVSRVAELAGFVELRVTGVIDGRDRDPAWGEPFGGGGLRRRLAPRHYAAAPAACFASTRSARSTSSVLPM